MKKYSWYIPLVNGLFTFLCFGLPWIHDETGIELTNSGGGGWIVAIAFIASLVIILSSIIRKSRMVILVCSCVGLLCLLPLFFYKNLNLSLDILTSFPIDIKYGVFLTAVGFFLTFVGTLDFIQLTQNSKIDNNEDSQGDEK